MRYLQIARAARSGTPVKNGAIAGGVIGLLAGLAVGGGYSTVCGFGQSDSCPEAILIGVLGGAALGAALGAGIGAIVQGASSQGGGWIDVPLDRTRLGIAPAPTGVAVGARIAF
jgi:hypothetical protein